MTEIVNVAVGQRFPITAKRLGINGEGIGYFSMSVVMATAIGPLIGVSLISAYGFTSIFLFSFSMAGVSLILGLTVKAPPMKVIKKEKTRK